MPVSPFSRYRGLDVLELAHQTRGRTRALPVRRRPAPPLTRVSQHRFTGFETADLLALRHYGREDLFWWVLDANGGRAPDSFAPGEIVAIAPLELATQVRRPG